MSQSVEPLKQGYCTYIFIGLQYGGANMSFLAFLLVHGRQPDNAVTCIFSLK